MTERPILFSTPMVRALLEGRKTQTRRPLYGERKIRGDRVPTSATVFLRDHPPPVGRRPDVLWCLGRWHKVVPDDVLWVREAWTPAPGHLAHLYRADHPDADVRWRPSIHMPREWSRLTLKVTATRIERLRDISEEDAQAEGCQEGLLMLGHGGQTVLLSDRDRFFYLWRDLHGTASWEANPEVVVISFEVIRGKN